MQPCVGFSLHEGASKHIGLDAARALVLAAFGAWDDTACPAGGEPSIEVYDLGSVSCDEKEYNQHAGNANLVVFRDDAWPYAGAGNTLALTTVTFNLDDGAIYDADLEVNGTVPLTTGDDGVEYDVASIVTHEAGHFLGLSHSPEPTATMIVEYAPGDLSLRTLAPDDVAAICATYPPGPVAEDDCDPTPRHGMSSICDPPVPEPEGGCTCSVAGSASSRPVERTRSAGFFNASGGLMVALFAATLARRARVRRRALGPHHR